MRMRRTISLGVAVLIGSAGLASWQLADGSAGFISLTSNSSYHIQVDGGGATPSAAEANAASRVPDNCTKPWVIDGPYINDGEWVVVEEATCVPED